MYLLERLNRMTHIPVGYFDESGNCLLFSYGCESSDCPLICDKNLKNNMISKLPHDGTPFLEVEEDIFYGACRDKMENIIFMGPVSRVELNGISIRKYIRQHNILNSQFKICCKSLDEFSSALALMCHMITGKNVVERDIISNRIERKNVEAEWENACQVYLLDSTEQEVSRFSLSHERELITCIKEGDVEAVIKRGDANLPKFDIESVGNLARNRMKHNEYLACTAIAVATRAAIEGGIDIQSAYMAGDLFLQRLEKSTSIPEITQLIQDTIVVFTKMVRENKAKRSQYSHTEECKNYIVSHLNKKFTVEDIATEIGINGAYLSRKFTELEGIPIKKYVQKKRIDASKNMLIYSDESLLSISNYLCFASQSHFCQVFKKNTGLTPQKYRNKNKLIDF